MASCKAALSCVSLGLYFCHSNLMEGCFQGKKKKALCGILVVLHCLPLG